MYDRYFCWGEEALLCYSKKNFLKLPLPFFILQSIPVFLHTLPHAGARPIAKPQTDQHNTAAAVYAKKAVYTTTSLHLVLFFYQSSQRLVFDVFLCLMKVQVSMEYF